MTLRKFALVLPVAALIAGCQSSSKNAEREQQLEQRVQQLERQLLEAQMASPSPAAPTEVAAPAVEMAPAARAQAAPRTRTAPAPVERTQTARRPARSSGSTAGQRTASRDDGDLGAPPANDERYGRRPSAEPVEVGDDEGYSDGRIEPVEPRATALVLPEGTELTLVLEEPLSSTASHPGDPVTARVERATSEDGRIVLPGGTVLQGRVSDARPSGRVSGRARVAVDFDRIVVRGRTHELDASPIVAEAPGEGSRDAKVVGGSAAAGAILGAIADGKKGAVRGAVIGAGAGGAAVLITKGREIEMPAGSRWTVRVRNSVRL
jgi:type IV secretory pathway VirB10-like protein